MQVVQAELVRGSTHLVCWLPVDRNVKVGSVISIKDEEGQWTVLQQYGRQDHTAINRGWNNNI